MKAMIQRFGLSAALLLTILSASAYDFEVDGIYYNITSMSNLEVGVTHKYSYNPKKNDTYDGVVTIPASVNYNNRTYTVTSVLEYAFGGANMYSDPNGAPVNEIVLPNTIKSINAYSFANCTQLTSCTWPTELQYIGEYAFRNTAITDVVTHPATETLGGNAFSDCTKIKSVIIGNNVKSIGNGVFSHCSSLLEVFFTGSAKPTISTSAFYSTHGGMERYVPSVAVYGFGKEYVTFAQKEFAYTGQQHNIEWQNNLKAYKCEIAESECKTDVNAGTYTKYLTAKYSDGVDISVDIPYTYTIAKAPMSLAVNDVQREYGDPNPAFTCAISGFVNGETEQGIGATPTFECEATQQSNVGDYRILASLEAPNYDITYKYGTLSVIKAPLSVSVVNASKTYGEANPQFELSYSGLKNSQAAPVWSRKPVFSTLADRQSDVGQYEVTASGGEVNNYEVNAYATGILTVNKKDLTVNANNCSRLYGEDNPKFGISYVGFVNGDSESSLESQPEAECVATKESNAGTYPITVSGGSAKNYNFVYKDGMLTVKPLSVGFKDVYNSVTYNDMAVSSNDRYFNYIPEIVGPFSDDDFWIELWFLDSDNRYNDHVATITSGSYAGNYVNTNYDRTMWAGKYIFNLTSKGNNPNVVANPSRAYLTINRASTNLEWDTPSPISVKVGEKVDLGISYQADLWCKFNKSYDDQLIELTSKGETSNDPHWYATGLKEGETTLYFGIECQKNDMGFYDFSDSRTLSKKIIVSPSAAIDDLSADYDNVSVTTSDGRIIVSNLSGDARVKVYNMQGALVAETSERIIDNLSPDLYIVSAGSKTVKVMLK